MFITNFLIFISLEIEAMMKIGVNNYDRFLTINWYLDSRVFEIAE